MDINKLRENWDAFGKTDPLWAILTANGKRGNSWTIEEFFGTGRSEIENLLKHLAQLNATPQFGKALDFGCGVGRLSQALAEYFEEVYGVDIAASMINLANLYNTAPQKCKYMLNEYDNLDIFYDNTFDFIYTNIVLQHMKPKYSKKYIVELIRILKANGSLVFQLPSERVRDNKPYKVILRRFIPAFLLDYLFYVRLKLSNKLSGSGPAMEMYAIKKQNVIDLLTQNGAKVIDIRKDEMNHGRWESYVYYAIKL